MPETIHTDEQLIDRIKASDKIAFRTLFDRYYKMLLGTAINILKDSNSAKDSTQEVFLQLWKNRTSIAIQSSPKAYLKRAVINRSLNQIKSRKAFVDDTPLMSMHSSSPNATEHLEAEDIEKAMKKAMETLPERCRVIFVMRRLEGVSVKEIAEQLSISPKTVENQITKALKILQKAVRPFVENK